MKRQSFGAVMALWVAASGVFASGSASADQPAAEPLPPAGVLAIGGDMTEIVYALDQGHRLLARDSTSTWPEAARALPDVGYMRALSPEAVLSVGPSLILSAEGAGPPETLDVLRAADIDFVEVTGGFDGAAIAAKIHTIGDALGVPGKAETLAQEVTTALAAAKARADANPDPRKRVLFVLSAAGGKLTVGGAETGADAVIRLAGGVNAAEGFDGYKQLSDEAAAVAAPDVILMMERGGDHGTTADVLFSLPALAITPAADTRTLIKIDGLKLLGFGPRTAEAVTELTTLLYGG